MLFLSEQDPDEQWADHIEIWDPLFFDDCRDTFASLLTCKRTPTNSHILYRKDPSVSILKKKGSLSHTYFTNLWGNAQRVCCYNPVYLLYYNKVCISRITARVYGWYSGYDMNKTCCINAETLQAVVDALRETHRHLCRTIPTEVVGHLFSFL